MRTGVRIASGGPVGGVKSTCDRRDAEHRQGGQADAPQPRHARPTSLGLAPRGSHRRAPGALGRPRGGTPARTSPRRLIPADKQLPDFALPVVCTSTRRQRLSGIRLKRRTPRGRDTAPAEARAVGTPQGQRARRISMSPTHHSSVDRCAWPSSRWPPSPSFTTSENLRDAVAMPLSADGDRST